MPIIPVSRITLREFINERMGIDYTDPWVAQRLAEIEAQIAGLEQGVGMQFRYVDSYAFDFYKVNLTPSPGDILLEYVPPTDGLLARFQGLGVGNFETVDLLFTQVRDGITITSTHSIIDTPSFSLVTDIDLRAGDRLTISFFDGTVSAETPPVVGKFSTLFASGWIRMPEQIVVGERP